MFFMAFVVLFMGVTLQFVMYKTGPVIKAIFLIFTLLSGHWMFINWFTRGQYHLEHATRYYLIFSDFYSAIYVIASIQSEKQRTRRGGYQLGRIIGTPTDRSSN